MKKLLLFASAVFVLSIILTVSIFAADQLYPGDSDVFGTVSTLETPVGRTDLTCLNDDGTMARVVLYNKADGKYYTFPSTYVMTQNPYAKNLMVISLSELNTALGTSYTTESIYRYEMPTSVTGTGKDGGQKFNGFTNLKELRLKVGSYHATNNYSSMFQDCVNLEVIHNLETITCAAGTPTVSGMYQSCKKLKHAVVPYGTTGIGYRMFMDCESLETITFQKGPNGEEPVSITSIDTQAFQKTYALDYFDIPSTVITIGQNAFNGSGIKRLTLPSGYTYNSSHWNTFMGCTNLEYADLSGCSAEAFPACFLADCTNLKVVVLNDSLKTLGKQMFQNCTSLEFLYLPSGLVSLGVGDKYNQGAFFNCSSLYFVQEKYTIDSFVTDGAIDQAKYTQNKPVCPDIYYFPSTIESLDNIANPFRGCTSINPTVVFGEKLTAIHKDGHTFASIGTKDNPKNIVFLGNVTNFYYSNTYAYINFYFVGSSKATFTINNANLSNEGGKVYICGESGYYNLHWAGSKADWVETDTPAHIFEKSMSTEATCELPKMVASYCFCSAIIGEPETDGAPLGHAYNGGVSYEFISLTAPGAKYTECTNNCGKPQVDAIGAVYTALGYSVKAFGNDGFSFISGYDVDVDSLAIYEDTKGVSLEFGFAFNAASTFTDGEVTLDSFKIVAPVAGSMGDIVFSFYQYQMTYSDSENLDKDIIIAAYVIEKSENSESLTFINRAGGEANGFDVISYKKALELAQ